MFVGYKTILVTVLVLENETKEENLATKVYLPRGRRDAEGKERGGCLRGLCKELRIPKVILRLSFGFFTVERLHPLRTL